MGPKVPPNTGFLLVSRLGPWSALGVLQERLSSRQAASMWPTGLAVYQQTCCGLSMTLGGRAATRRGYCFGNPVPVCHMGPNLPSLDLNRSCEAKTPRALSVHVTVRFVNFCVLERISQDHRNPLPNVLTRGD